MPGVTDGRKPGSYEWYEIQDNIAYWQEFERPKIVYPDIAPNCRFLVDQTQLYPDCTLFLVPDGSRLLLSVLNSTINEYFFPQICPRIRGGYLRFKSIYMSQIPIPPATPDQQRLCETLTGALIWLHEGWARSPEVSNVGLMKAYFEQWLNGLVYELFFPGELHSRKLNLFDQTAKLDLPDLTKVPEKQKLEHLQEAFSKAHDRSATLRAMLSDLKSLEVVRVIEDVSSPAGAEPPGSDE